MADDWVPVEQAAKNDKGEFQVLHGGVWKPAKQVAKNDQGKYVAYGLSGAAAAPEAHDPAIPYPEFLAAERAEREKNLKAETPMERLGHGVKSTAEFVGSMGPIGAGMAVGGRGLQLAGKAIPKVAEAGEAIATVGRGMLETPWKQALPQAAAMGGTVAAAVDLLKSKFGMSDEAANNVVMAATVSPAAGAAAARRLFPQLSSVDAKSIVQKMFGGKSGMITEQAQKDQMEKGLSRLGGGGDLKQETSTLSAGLASAAKNQEAQIRAEGTEEKKRIAGRIKHWIEGKKAAPEKAEAARVQHLGPDTTDSTLGDEVRINVVPKAIQSAAKKLSVGKQQWDAMLDEAHRNEAMGRFVNNQAGAQDAVAFIDDLVMPNKDGIRKWSQNNPLVGKLLGWKERLLGDPVEMGPKPNFRSFVSEVLRGAHGVPGGIDPAFASEFSSGRTGLSEAQAKRLFKPGGMTLDDLVEFAGQRGWVTEHEMEMAHKNRIGGQHDVVIEKILNELNGTREFHPTEFDAAQEWLSKVAQNPRRIGVEEFDVLRKQLAHIADTPSTAPGYDKELSANARALHKMVTRAMSNHAPGTFSDALVEFHEAASADNEFATRLAKAIIERDPNDAGQMRTPANQVAQQVFAGRDQVNSFKRMLGGSSDPQAQATVDKLGLAFVSSNLKGMDAKTAEKWLEGSYKDWAEELSKPAQERVKKFLSDLKAAEAGGEKAAKGVSENLAVAKGFQATTEKRVAETAKQLLGGKEPVPRIKELIKTPGLNRDEVGAVFKAVLAQPGGKQAFHRAVEAVIKDEAEKNGKTVLETFDNIIADKLLNAGTHTDAEIKGLRSLVADLDEIANANVASQKDFDDNIRQAVSRNVKRGAVWAALVGAVGGGAIGSGHSAIGGATLGAEGVGLYFSKNAWARNAQSINDAIGKIVADKELYNAAIAPPTDGSVRRFMAMLAQKSAAIQAGQAVEHKVEKKVGMR